MIIWFYINKYIWYLHAKNKNVQYIIKVNTMKVEKREFIPKTQIIKKSINKLDAYEIIYRSIEGNMGRGWIRHELGGAIQWGLSPKHSNGVKDQYVV